MEEDPTPVETGMSFTKVTAEITSFSNKIFQMIKIVTTCGGDIEASSAAINFQLDTDIPPGQSCVWIVKPNFESTRVRLVSSGLLAGSGIYFTELNTYSGTPGEQVQM